MKVLVTGGAGYIGSQMAYTLLDAGYDDLDHSHIADSSVTFSSADSGHVMDKFSIYSDGFRTAKYLITSRSTTGGDKIQSTELLVLWGGSDAYITQGPTLMHGMTGDSYHVDFIADRVGTEVVVKATTTVVNTEIKYHRTSIKN